MNPTNDLWIGLIYPKSTNTKLVILNTGNLFVLNISNFTMSKKLKIEDNRIVLTECCNAPVHYLDPCSDCKAKSDSDPNFDPRTCTLTVDGVCSICGE